MDTTIIVQGALGVHHGAGETLTVSRNGEPFAIPLGVPTPVPQWVVEVLTDSRVMWARVDAAPAEHRAAPAAGKKKTEDDD